MRNKRTVLILVVAACLLFTTSVMAMTSPNFAIGWLVPLSGGGGQSATSPGYSLRLTIGQTAIGSGESASYRAEMGFWRGVGDAAYKVRLPHVLR